MHAINAFADLAVPLKVHGVFYISLLNQCFVSRIRICGEILRHVNAEHMFISNGYMYLYAPTAC